MYVYLAERMYVCVQQGCGNVVLLLLLSYLAG